MSVTVGEIDLELVIKNEDLSKTLNKIAQNITEKFSKAFNELASDFKNSENEIKKSISETGSKIEGSVSQVSDRISENFNTTSQKLNLGFKKVKANSTTVANNISTQFNATFKKIGAAIAAAFSAKMIASFGKSCIDLGSDLAEVQNVVDVTFTTMSDKVNEWAVNAQKAYGLSETMAKKYVGTFGSMAEAFGFTEKQSYDMATALAGLTGDVASFYNLDQDLAYTKLKSVFSGETETLKDLGIVMTQSALDNYALANGYGKTVSQMTEAEKVTLRYNFVLGQLKNATGDFTRTQDSWANQTRVLSLRIDSLKATIGQGLINTFTPVIKVLNTLIDRLSTVSEKFKALTEQIFGNAGGSTAGGVDTAIADSASSAESLTNEANNSSAALDSIADSAEKAKRSVAGFDKLNILSQETKTETNSTTPTTSAQNQSSGNGLTSAMSKSVDKLVSSWNSKGQKVIDSIKKLFSSVKGVVESFGKSWDKVWNNGSGEKLLNNIKDLLKHCFENVGYIADAFKKAWDNAGLGNSVVQSIIDRADSLIGLIDVIAEDFGKIWNNGAGERIWGNILSTIRNCNNATKTLRDKIKEAWDKNDTGKKIWQDVLGIVEDITGFMEEMSAIRLEWLENLDLSPIMESVEKLGGAFRELLQACGDKLKTAYKNILLPLAKWTIEKGAPKLVEMLADALKGVSDIIKKISPNTLDAIAGAVAGLGTAFLTFKAGQALASGITKVKTAMKLLMTTLEAHPIIALVSGVAAAITGLVTAIKLSNDTRWKDLGFEDVSNDMQNALDKINGCKDSINEMCEEIDTSLSETSTEMGVIDDYKIRLDELLSKANLTPEEQADLVTIGDYFSKKYPDFEKAWNDYIQKDDSGKIVLTENADVIKGKLDELIAKYKQVAATSALTNLAEENQTSYIKAQSGVEKAAVAYQEAQQALADFKKEWNFDDSDMDFPDFYTWQSTGKITGFKGNATVGDLKKQYNDLTEKLSEAESAYDSTAEKAAQLQLNSNDLAKMQAVVNGNYDDASAVLMAYNATLITSTDIENSKWKSLDNLKSKAKEVAKDTGSNVVFGMNNGIDSVKEQIKEKGLESAALYLDALNGKEGLDEHSPSKKTYQSGVYAVAGFVNAISDNTKRVQTVISEMVRKIKTALEPTKSVFTSVFSGIAAVVRNPLNTMMSMLERFVNGFVSAINGLSSGADWAINNIGQIFGQEWHIGRLDKITLPRFAKGAIVKAPTLAVVGDNAGANTGNPEVIAPLNKLQQMINTSSGQDVVILSQILDYLKRIYELFVVFRNNGGNMYEFVAKLNGSTLFDEMIYQNELYKKRHNGKPAFL